MPDILKISKIKLNRRAFLAGTAGSLASPFVIPSLAADVLVVNTQGGEYQEIVERTVIKPFEKKFGVQVTHDPTGTAAEDGTAVGETAEGGVASARGKLVAGVLAPAWEPNPPAHGHLHGGEAAVKRCHHAERHEQ